MNRRTRSLCSRSMTLIQRLCYLSPIHEQKDARLLLHNALASVGKIQMLNMLKVSEEKVCCCLTSLVSVFVALRLSGRGPGAARAWENAVVYLPNCLK